MSLPRVVNTPVSVAYRILLRYLDEKPECTFGAWTLARVFPDASPEALYAAREFIAAQRPSDARYYLIGMLRLDELPLDQAIQFLNEPVVVES